MAVRNLGRQVSAGVYMLPTPLALAKKRDACSIEFTPVGIKASMR